MAIVTVLADIQTRYSQNIKSVSEIHSTTLRVCSVHTNNEKFYINTGPLITLL